MKNKLKVIRIPLTVLSITAASFMASCSINDPTAPRWDVSLNVPILKKNYTMYDIIEKKSREINHYSDGANQNILYYTDIKTLDKIEVKDELKIDPFSESTSKSIGTISIASDSVQTHIGYDWVGVPVVPGTSVVLPAINNADVNEEFTSVDQFEYAIVESGAVDLSFTNNMPVPVNLTINNLEIRNSQSGELIINYGSEINVGPLQTVKVSSLPIVPGVIVRRNLTLICRITTNGSNLSPILLPPNSLTVKATMKNIEVTEASGKIPDQDPVEIDDAVSIDANSAQPTKFQNVKLENGSFNLTVVNNLDIDAAVTITIPNLKNSQGTVLAATRTIPRKQTVKIFDNLSLRNFSLESLNGTATDRVSYNITYEPLASNDFRTVKNTDDVSGNVEFSSLQINEFTGQLEPTELEETRSAVSLDVKDLQDKLKFQQINLKNPIVELRLKPTAQTEFTINGRMEARNTEGQRSVMTLSSRTLNKTLITPNDTIITLNPDSVSNFFKKFSKFPDSLIVYAGGTINPNYKTVVIKNSDNVTGRSRIEFPLELGISEGEITDSVEVDLSDDDRDKIKDLNSFDISLKITNGIPAQVSFTGKLYDEFNNFLMYFPPLYADQDTLINFPGASVDGNGNVTGKSERTVHVKMLNGDPEKLSRANYMRVRIKFNTSGQNNNPVKFKTDDTIDISSWGLIDYVVNSEGR